MTIAFIAATTTAAAGAVTGVTVAEPAGTTASSISILAVETKRATAATAVTVSTPTGWTLIGALTEDGSAVAPANDVGTNGLAVFYRIGTGYGATTITTTNVNSMGAGISAYSTTLGGWDVSATATGSDTASGANGSITFGATVAIASGDWGLVSTSLSGDLGTITAETLAATGVTLGTRANRTNLGVTTGNDSRLLMSDWPATAGTASAAATYTWTNTSSLTGHARLVRLREVLAAPTGVSAGADDSHPVNVAFTRIATATGATSHEWKIQTGTGAGTVIGTAASLNWTPTSTGTYVLRYTATNSAGSTPDDMTLTVVTPVSLSGVTDRVSSMTGVVYRIRAADLALTHGASVTSWTTLVGSAMTGTGTFRTASTINNRPVVQFNGASDTYTNATSHTSISNRTLGFVYASRTIAATDRELYAAGSTEVILNTDFIKVFGGAGNAISSSAVAVDTPYVTTATASTTANEVIYHNGTSVANAEAGALSATTSVRIGSSGGTSRWHDGPIAEFVIWDHELDATERAAWHSYVQDAYGITVSDYVAGSSTPITLTDTATVTDAVAVVAGVPLTETATVTDAVTVTAAVPFIETATVTDALTVSVKVPLTETATVTDALASGISVQMADTVSVTDAVAVAAAVPLADTATVTDAVSVAAKVSVTDVITATDTLAVAAQVPMADTATVTDALSVAIFTSKSLDDTATVSDTFAVTAKTIPLADTATVTDDLTTPARTIPLTETATVTDALVLLGQSTPLPGETVTVTDAVTVAVKVPLDDTAAVTDAVTVAAKVSFTETATVTDALVVNQARSLTETATVTDTFAATVAVGLAETIGVADNLTVTVKVPLTENVTVTDAVTVSGSANPAVTDTISVTDTFSVSVRVPMADTATVTDAVAAPAVRVPLADSVTLTDSMAVTVRVPMADTIGVSDELAVLVAVLLADAVTVADDMVALTVVLRDIKATWGAGRSRTLSTGSSTGEPRIEVGPGRTPSILVSEGVSE